MPLARSRTKPLPLWPLGRGAPPPGRFIALVPGEEAPLIALALPAGLRGAARLAVARRQVRDRLGPAAEALDLRPAPLGAGGDGWAALLAADRALLARWRGELGAASARTAALIPDYLALPAAPGLWVLAVSGDGARLRARLGPGDGFSAETALAALMLARARGAAPRAVLVVEGVLPAEAEAALEGLFVTDDPARLPAGLSPPEALTRGEIALDLRSDTGLETERRAAGLRVFALSLLLAALGAGGWAGAVAVETARLRDHAAALDEATLALVRRDILPEGPILDIRLQIDREIARRGAAAGAQGTGLDLLRRAAEGLTQAGVMPQALSLSPAGAVVVELTLPGFAALEQAAAGLAASGLSVEITRSASTGAGQVGAALTLGRAFPDGAAP